MDSIPWEKAQLEAEEKPHYVLNKKNMRTIERTSRCALDLKDFCIFIEGACDHFLLSDFPVLAKNRFTWMESRWESLLS